MYRGRLQRDLDVWVQKGLLTGDVADSLLKDYDGRPHSFSVGGVLTMLAAVLVAAAILLFVAANWGVMPRSARLTGLILLIWSCHGLASFTAARGAGRLPVVFLILGSAAFGASIALVGQMYNLAGDEMSAAFIWFAGTVVAAVLYRSPALTYMASLLAWFGFCLLVSERGGGVQDLWFHMPLIEAAAVFALLRYTGANRARHLIYTLVLIWLAWAYPYRQVPFEPWHFIVLGTGCFLLATLPVSPLRQAARQAGAAPAFYSLVLSLLGFLLYQFNDNRLFGDRTDLSAALPAGLAAAMAVLAIALDGRDNVAVRYLGYAVFSLEILFLSLNLVGTMLGTSGLFLFSGFVLAGIAWLVVREERRFATASDEVRP